MVESGLQALCWTAAELLNLPLVAVWRDGRAPVGAGLTGAAGEAEALAALGAEALRAWEVQGHGPHPQQGDLSEAAALGTGFVCALALAVAEQPPQGVLILRAPDPRILSSVDRTRLAELATTAASLLTLGRACERAAETVQFLSVLAENSADTLVRGNLEGVRQYISPACRELLGYEPEELVGRRAAEIVHPEDLPTFAKLMAELCAGRIQRARSEQRQRHKNGSWVWLEAFIRLTEDPVTGQPDGYVVSVRDISQRKAAEQRLAHLAAHDALTGLANRSLLQERLEAELARAGRTDGGLAVLCLDLDRFKPVNDTFGHEAGDTVLRIVAERLIGVTRADDLVARLGGDEFVVLQGAHASPKAGAEQLAARLLPLIMAPMDIQGESMVVGVSIGIAVASPADVARGITTGALLRAGDLALYAAKESGRGRYVAIDLAAVAANTA